MSNFMKNVPKIINGDTVIGFTSSKKVKDIGWADVSSLSSWYEEDPNKNHFGLVELFTNMADVRMPSYKDFFKKGAVLEVNGINGTFTYDTPVTKPDGTYTEGDTSDYSDALGIDGEVFPIILGEPFQPGDVLTYDVYNGEQIVVSEDHTVERVGDAWKHWVKLSSLNSWDMFPADKLKEGIQYYKIGHVLGEFSEQFSNISSPTRTGTITSEFTLGNHRGVETFYTMYADKKQFSGAALHSQRFWNKFVSEMEALGSDSNGNPLDMFYVAKLKKGTKSIDKSTVRIGASLEYLVLLELMKMENHQLLFQKGGIINDINGTKRLNEGLLHQIRRGTLIKYSKPGGITRTHIKQAAAVLFQGRKSIMPHERRLKFKAGFMAYMNVMSIFRDEVLAQVSALAPFIGSDRLLPNSPVKGKSLTSLELEPVMFTKVNIPDIGIVEIEYDPSLDYTPLTDKHSAGFFGDGYNWSSYSLVIWDAADPEYSNALTGVKGADIIDGGSLKENVYYVKPQGDGFWWGYSNGRYSPDNAKGIMSSMKRMGREFWAHSVSAAWVKDVTRYITIELKR